MIAIGAYRIIVLGEHRRTPPEVVAAPRTPPARSSIVLLLRAFASGAVALTGTEAIATGVPAFKPPEAKNAATTLLVMAGVLAVLFVGITFLATNFAASVPELDERGQADRHRPGRRRPSSATTRSLFYLFQAFTALLLFLAANTSFAAFPRLAAVLGEDGFFPRQFASAATASRSRRASSLLGVIAASLVVIVPAARPTPSSRSTRSACSSTSRSARPA